MIVVAAEEAGFDDLYRQVYASVAAVDVVQETVIRAHHRWDVVVAQVSRPRALATVLDEQEDEER